MAVHKRSYKGYSGALTPAWSRFLIVRRYSQANLLKSKFLLMLLVVCIFYPLGCIFAVYLNHNLSFIKLVTQARESQLFDIDGSFFSIFLSVQGSMAVILTAFVGPGLVSPDLVNNALPLYFCRPFSRWEFVLGKMSVLIGLLSAITWVPGLIVFIIQASLEGNGWWWSNLWIASGVFVVSLVWIMVLSVLALALSAWVKWRIIAGALVLGVFFAGAGFGEAINAVMRTDIGDLINLAKLMANVGANLLRVKMPHAMPIERVWIDLTLACAFCLWLLTRKVRAYEVVK